MNLLSLPSPIAQCSLQHLHCTLCACIRTQTTCELCKWILFHYGVWDWVRACECACEFFLSFTVCWGRGAGSSVRRVCTSAPSIPSWALKADSCWQLDPWNIHRNTTLNIPLCNNNWLHSVNGYVWYENECVYLQLHEAEYCAGVCDRSHGPEPKVTQLPGPGAGFPSQQHVVPVIRKSQMGTAWSV